MPGPPKMCRWFGAGPKAFRGIHREAPVLRNPIDCKKGKLFKEFIEIIKKPSFGHGSGINPCIDCKIFMLSRNQIGH